MRTWIDPVAFAAALRAAKVPGTRFVPIWFVPRERQYRDQRCGGVQILIVDWNVFDPMKLGLALAVTLRAHYPAEWKLEGILTMLADRASYQAILTGRTLDEIESLWQADLEAFRRTRAKYLIYDRDRQ